MILFIVEASGNKYMAADVPNTAFHRKHYLEIATYELKRVKAEKPWTITEVEDVVL